MVSETKNHWKSKVWYAYGTSMTSVELGKYVPVVTELSGLITTNLGIPGGDMTSDILKAIKTSPSNGVDLVTVEGGVNDWARNISLGEFGDTEPTTYYGALYQAFEYLTKCTDSRVVSITMHGDRSFESVLGGSWLKNANGVRMTKFNEALREMSAIYSVPCILVAEESGLNEGNYNKYLIDQIHHNELGGKVVGKYVWSKLKDIPILP